MDDCLSVLFVVLTAWGVFSLVSRRESREVQQFIQMLVDALRK